MAEAGSILGNLLAPAGITANGDAPWDPRIHDDRFYERVLAQGSLGLGESYMDGWWDCEELETFFFRVLSAGLSDTVRSWRDLPRLLHARWTNRGRRSKAFEIGERHYDLGNDLYETMLDRRLVYSCACWPGAAEPRRGAGGEAGPRLPQGPAEARDARPGHRLRLGRIRGLRRGALRRARRRRHRLERAGRARPRAHVRSPRRAPPQGLP